MASPPYLLSVLSVPCSLSAIRIGGNRVFFSDFLNLSVSSFARPQPSLSRSPPVSLRHYTADDARSVSSGSELHTPMKHHHAPPSPRQDPGTNSPVAWRPVAWNRSGHSSIDINRRGTHISMVDNLFSQEADVTARIYSSSSSTTESSAEEAAVRRHQQELHRRASRRHHRHNRGSESDRHRTRSTAERDEKTTATAAAVALLRSELDATRSQVEQKEVVTRSLQRQLDQVSFIT